MTFRPTILAAAALLALNAVSASATVAKTWVSSTGTDSGTCQFVAPCKTLQFAHDQTSPGGEIDVKDSGSYGPLRISKSISVTAEGVLATLGANGSDLPYIDVQIGASDVVVLHGLSLDGHGFAYRGILTGSLGKLVVDHCLVRNFGIGVFLQSISVLTNNVFTGNGFGIQNNSGTNHIGGNVISANNYGVFVYSGKLYSYGDNNISGNETDVSGAISVTTKK